MRFKFQALAALAAVCLLAAIAGGQAIARGNATVNVQLLALSELHGAIAPPAGSGGRVGTVDAGGAEYLATHLKQLEATNPNTITVASGDNIGASPLVSALFHDEPTIDALNAMGLDFSSVGNHEFDEGVQELRRVQNGGCNAKDGCQFEQPFRGASFKYLAANVLVKPTAAQIAAVKKYNAKQRGKLKAHKRFCAKKANRKKGTCRRAFHVKLRALPTPQQLFPPYAVKTVGGVKVGFIGEVLQGTGSIVVPTAVAGVQFLPEAATANKYAAILQKQGVQTIVLLLHQGNASGPDPNGCGPAGDLEPIVNGLAPSIDVVATGHSGGAYVCTINNKLVTQASTNGRMITKIDLTIDTSTGDVTSKTGKNLVVTRDVPKDPAQTAILSKAQQLSGPLANRVVGSVTSDISRSQNRSGESALGDVIADAQLASTSPANKGGAVVAFMNPGGIRADLLANQQSGGEQPGQVTYGELFTVQPFSNVMTVMTLTGKDIKDLLEQQFDNPSPGQTRFLQVSSGFSYSYKLNAPAGQHVDQSSIKINGVTVDPAKQYRVAENNFLATGGDNFTVFKRGTNQLGGDIDLDALVAYFQAKSPIAPGPQNRFTRTD